MSCWGRKGHALEILWLQEVTWEFLTALHHKEMNLSLPETPIKPPLIQHFCWHPEQQQSPSQCAFESDPPWCGLVLTGTQSQIKPNSPDRLFCTYANNYCCASRFSPSITTGFDFTLNLPWVTVSKVTKVQTTRNPTGDRDWLHLAQKSIKMHYLRKKQIAAQKSDQCKLK